MNSPISYFVGSPGSGGKKKPRNNNPGNTSPKRMFSPSKGYSDWYTGSSSVPIDENNSVDASMHNSRSPDASMNNSCPSQDAQFHSFRLSPPSRDLGSYSHDDQEKIEGHTSIGSPVLDTKKESSLDKSSHQMDPRLQDGTGNRWNSISSIVINSQDEIMTYTEYMAERSDRSPTIQSLPSNIAPSAYTMMSLQVVEYDLEKNRLPLTLDEETIFGPDALHRRFQLSSEEVLVEDYACALQGRMYIFPRHVCFSYDLLGNSKSIKIGFYEIIDIKKAKTALIIPNAIKILTPSRKFIFTSFIFRDEAVKALMSLWYIHMGTIAAKEMIAAGGPEDSGAKDIASEASSQSPQQSREGSSGNVFHDLDSSPTFQPSLYESINGHQNGSIDSNTNTPSTPGVGSLGETPTGGHAGAVSDGLDWDASSPKDVATQPSRLRTSPTYESESAHRIFHRSHTLDPHLMSHHAGEETPEKPFAPKEGNSFAVTKLFREHRSDTFDYAAQDLATGIAPTGSSDLNQTAGFKSSPSRVPSGSAASETGDDEEDQATDIVVRAMLNERDATPCDLPLETDTKMYPLPLVEEFPLPSAPHEVYRALFSTSSGFDAHFKASRGEKNVTTSPWALVPDGHCSFSREVNYASPVSKQIGPFNVSKETRVIDSQICRLSRVPKLHFTLRSTIRFLDIPFGDSFTVVTRWDVSEAVGSGALVTIRGDVAFSKSTLFKGKITSETAKDLKECYSSYLNMAQEYLSGQLPIRTPSASTCPQQPAASIPRSVKQPLLSPIPTPIRGTPIPTPISPGAGLSLLMRAASLSASQGPPAYLAPPRAGWRHNTVLGILVAAMGMLVMMLKVLQRDAAFGVGGAAVLLQEGALREKRVVWEAIAREVASERASLDGQGERGLFAGWMGGGAKVDSACIQGEKHGREWLGGLLISEVERLEEESNGIDSEMTMLDERLQKLKKQRGDITGLLDDVRTRLLQ